MKYAIPMAGFHVAPNLAGAGEFTIYDHESNTLTILNLPTTVRGVMIPSHLRKEGVQVLVCDKLDATVLFQCQDQGIRIFDGYEGEIEPIVDRIRWNALDGKEHHHDLPSQTGCSSGNCGGSSIDQLKEQMVGAFKEPLPFDSRILPKKTKG